MRPLIELRQVCKHYRRGGQSVPVLHALDLDILAGDFLALMGPSGSGKTTLLNLIGGLDRASSGSVIVDGQALEPLTSGQLANWRARNVGFVFQFYNLLPVLSAARNVELPLLLTDLNASQRARHVAAALAVVGLADRARHRPTELSGGQAQRVAIALGMRSPQFFTAGLLSRIGELAVLKVIDQYQRQGGELDDEQVLQSLRDWAQPYGNKLKIQWFLPLELRQLIGAVHYLPRENVTQERLIMRAGALMAAKEPPEPELGKILRQLGLDEWHKQSSKDDQKHEDDGND